MSCPSSPLTPRAMPHPFRIYNSCYISSSSDPCMLHVISFHTVLCLYLTYMLYAPCLYREFYMPCLSHSPSCSFNRICQFSNHVVVYILCYSHRCVTVTTMLLSQLCYCWTVTVTAVTVTTMLLSQLCYCWTVLLSPLYYCHITVTVTAVLLSPLWNCHNCVTVELCYCWTVLLSPLLLSPLCYCHNCVTVELCYFHHYVTVTSPLLPPLCYCHHYVIVTTVLLFNFVTVSTVLLSLFCYCHHHLSDSSPSYETKCKIIVS